MDLFFLNSNEGAVSIQAYSQSEALLLLMNQRSHLEITAWRSVDISCFTHISLYDFRIFFNAEHDIVDYFELERHNFKF